MTYIVCRLQQGSTSARISGCPIFCKLELHCPCLRKCKENAGFAVFVLVMIMDLGEVIAQSTWGGDGSSLAGLTDFWVFRFLLNILGYASIVIPAAILIRYIKRSNFLERSAGKGCTYNVVKACVYGTADELPTTQLDSEAPAPSPSRFPRWAILIFCVVGLQGSYLTWGVLQERIMRHEYGGTEDEPAEKFQNSQFLVFVNRILALTIAGIYLSLFRQPRHGCPMYKYSYASLSNIMSSWCQYEALKFVSFPTQVLAKASKVIPVMLMGKLVSRKTYEYYEYVIAALISVGLSMFLIAHGPDDEKKSTTVTTFSGIILLAGYMMFDSFTANWQAELYKYKMSSFQMMFGVNCFSCLFTSAALLQQGGFIEAFSFMFRHQLFAFHVFLNSICSATGQMFIFFTINQFGAMVFVIIMTTRQALAILLSCIIYAHPVSIMGGFGIGIVFLAMFLRVYASHRMKQKKARQQENNTGVKV
ncbi:adenosine 3'-phospho 5'-phosphosulfate transporter 1-like isoform X1 [Branchiostoma floridae]|uniref:Adenosine 3'-phospho 5'-phosphosulfate transporter 1 n=2 Tax=Branchiostoma floridae TaxID=7739 RepID=A0A9J7KPQ8_BRAFL|nr:adenosine 3'-phospho 5'-phosphosulfate transporter 1-like isoform X1 [Branchiostoma floridae]